MFPTQKYALKYLYLYVVIIPWNIDTPQGGKTNYKNLRNTQMDYIDYSAHKISIPSERFNGI